MAVRNKADASGCIHRSSDPLATGSVAAVLQRKRSARICECLSGTRQGIDGFLDVVAEPASTSDAFTNRQGLAKETEFHMAWILASRERTSVDCRNGIAERRSEIVADRRIDGKSLVQSK